MSGLLFGSISRHRFSIFSRGCKQPNLSSFAFSAAKLRLILRSSKHTTEKLVKTYLRFRRDADSFRGVLSYGQFFVEVFFCGLMIGLLGKLRRGKCPLAYYNMALKNPCFNCLFSRIRGQTIGWPWLVRFPTLPHFSRPSEK